MPLGNPGEAARTELDLTAIERQPNAMLPGRSKVYIAVRNFKFIWHSYDMPATAVVGLVGIMLAVGLVCGVFAVPSILGKVVPTPVLVVTACLAGATMVATIFLARLVGRKVAEQTTFPSLNGREGRTFVEADKERRQASASWSAAGEVD